jgi:hypothetical protein
LAAGCGAPGRRIGLVGQVHDVHIFFLVTASWKNAVLQRPHIPIAPDQHISAEHIEVADS